MYKIGYCIESTTIKNFALKDGDYCSIKMKSGDTYIGRFSIYLNKDSIICTSIICISILNDENKDFSLLDEPILKTFSNSEIINDIEKVNRYTLPTVEKFRRTFISILRVIEGAGRSDNLTQDDILNKLSLTYMQTGLMTWAFLGYYKDSLRFNDMTYTTIKRFLYEDFRLKKFSNYNDIKDNYKSSYDLMILLELEDLLKKVNTLRREKRILKHQNKQ